jgi:glyoxylase-like metal-dependent hydrolase (beta-lactamase superfamily II)
MSDDLTHDERHAGALVFDRDDAVEYGPAQSMTPLLRRVMARNPSPFTFHGTGTFVVGRGRVAVVDPGPDLPEHVDALLAAVAGETVTHIVVTHTHLDHSPAARAVQAATGAPTFGYGPHAAGRLEAGMRVEAGADTDFVPDVAIRDGEVIDGGQWTLECVHTPGHTSNHVCFGLREERALLCGDHVMRWNTTVISPPDGDMSDYLASLEKLLSRDELVYWPTHGPRIEKPQRWVRALMAHRRARGVQILGLLGMGPASVESLTGRIYADLPERLHGAAARTVLATLVHLLLEGRVRADGEPGLATEFQAVPRA